MFRNSPNIMIHLDNGICYPPSLQDNPNFLPGRQSLPDLTRPTPACKNRHIRGGRETSKEKRAALLAVAIANVLVMMALTPASTVLPSIASDMGVGVTTASWMITSFLLTLVALLLTAGRLGDLYGHHRLFLWGTIVYAVTGVMCGFAQDILQLIMLRGIQGIGAALISGNSLAILTHRFDPAERGKAIGIAGMAASLGGLIGVLTGSVLTEYVSWRGFFFVLVPVGAYSLRCALKLRTSFQPAERPRVDIMGAVLLGLALVVFMLSFSHLHGGEATYTEGMPYHISMFGLALILGLAFVLAEAKHPQPMMELRHLRNKLFATSVASNGIMHMTMLASTFLIPFLVERGLGLRPIYTAGILISTSVSNMVAAPFSGWLYDRTGWRLLPPVAMVLLASCLVSLGMVAGAVDYWGYLAITFVLGIGLGCFQTPNNTIIMGILPPSYRGFTAGILETSRQLGHTLGVGASSAVLGLIIVTTLPATGESYAYLAGFKMAVMTAGFIAFVGAGLAIMASRMELGRRVHELAPEVRPADA